MSRILAVNPGSSTLKLTVIDGGVMVSALTVAPWDGTTLDELDDFAGLHAPFDAVAVRVVHGGDRAGPVLLDEGELAELETLVPLAPLHQPRSIALARRARTALPGVPVIGCFDTAFHAGLPEKASTYAVPPRWRTDFGVRRYGFHGLSVAHAVGRTAAILGSPVENLNVICCHLGAGVSVTAVSGGRSMDTSMGLTPLEGAVMATRSGSLDPGIPLYLMTEHGLSAEEVDRGLTHEGGLTALSGVGGDLRDVLAARERGDVAARLAVEVYLHRLRREIAAASVSLETVDAVVLTGGVAENQPGLRAELLSGARFGLLVDPVRNAASGDRVLSPPEVAVPVILVRCAEDLEMARQSEQALLALTVGVSS